MWELAESLVLMGIAIGGVGYLAWKCFKLGGGQMKELGDVLIVAAILYFPLRIMIRKLEQEKKEICGE